MVEKHRFTEGAEERDLMEAVYCKAFKKFLRADLCNPENCKHHEGIEVDRAIQDGKVVHEMKYVKCRYPEATPVVVVCEA